MYSQSMDDFVQLIYKWTKFTPQLEQLTRAEVSNRIVSKPDSTAQSVYIDDEKCDRSTVFTSVHE